MSIWASSSVEAAGTVRRLMAVFLRQDHGFDPSGSRQLPIKESHRDQCSVSLRQRASYLSLYCTLDSDRTRGVQLIQIGGGSVAQWLGRLP